MNQPMNEEYRVNVFRDAPALQLYLNQMPPEEAIMEIMQGDTKYTLISVVYSGLQVGEES